MTYKTIPVEFPNGEVKAAAVSNHNGSFDIYINALVPELIEQME